MIFYLFRGISFFVLSLFLFFPLFVFAETEGIPDFFSSPETASFFLDEKTIQNGYTFSLFDDNFRFALKPNILSEVSAIQFQKENSNFVFPIEGKRFLSPIFEYNIVNKEFFDNNASLLLEIKVHQDIPYYARIYFFDGEKNIWRALPGESRRDLGVIRASIHLPYARLALLEDYGILEEGEASWYRYRNCDCVASPDYEIGTKLRVTNLENKKTITATVNDFGPERNLHPTRVVDLDYEAFKKLASPKKGLIRVTVEPIFSSGVIRAAIVEPKKRNDLAFSGEIRSKAAVVFYPKTGEILYGKNEEAQLPIASITKLMMTEVFHDTHTPTVKEVMYKKRDNEEGSRLYVADGETMTVGDLYYSILTGSTNNAVNTLIRATALGGGRFVELMNKKAQEWGLGHTLFYDPTGLDPRNQSTAYEVALFSQKVFGHKEVLEATTIPQYSFSTLNTKQLHKIKNTNPLIGDTELYLTGGKTGYLDEAQYTLVSRSKNKDGQELIAVILGAPSREISAKESKALLLWGFQQL